jgi:hypothetical protein
MVVGSTAVTVVTVAALVVAAMVLDAAAAVLDEPTDVVGLREDTGNVAAFVDEHAAVSNNATKAKRCAKERGVTIWTAYVPNRSVGLSGVCGFVGGVAVVVDGFGGQWLVAKNNVGGLFGQHHHRRVDVAVGHVWHA